MIHILKGYYKKYERLVPIIFFVAGFIFDALMLRRVDEWLTIMQQLVYILISAWLIKIEIIESTEGHRGPNFPAWISRVWQYREALLHFLMGTLLNAYTIFFFKSASAISSFIFIFILVGLLMLNEFGRFGKSQTQVHLGLLSLCLVSYLSTISPIAFGFIGLLPFLTADAAAILLFLLYLWILKRGLGVHYLSLRTKIAAPFTGILSLFTILYFAHAIPPVPLSVQYMGIYHDIKKTGSDYILSWNRPRFRFWEHGDQTFYRKPGDEVYGFVRIFSPARFHDQMQVRWLFHDPRHGWVNRDLVALPILGGREEGYRGYTKKANFEVGVWRIQVETLSGQEVGRIGFEVIDDDGSEQRQLQTTID